MHTPAAPVTVFTLLLPLSHVTVPELLTLINLYSKYVPAAKLIVADHNGFELVYWEALNAIPLAVFQLPRAAIEPTILILVPYVVVTNSLNVTATEVQAEAAVVLVAAEVVFVAEVVAVAPVFVVATVENVVDTGAVVDAPTQNRDSILAQFSRKLH